MRSAGECRWVSLSAQQPPHSQVTLTGGSPTFSLGKPSLSKPSPLSLSLPLYSSQLSRTSLSTITLTLLNVLGLGAARRLKNAALGTRHRAQERAGWLHKTGPGISRQPPSSTTKHSSQNTVHRLRRTQYSTKPYLQETIQRNRKTQELPRIELIVHCATCENTMSRLRIVLDSNAHSKNRVRLVVAPCVPQVLPPERTQGRESTTPILIILLGMVFYTQGTMLSEKH